MRSKRAAAEAVLDRTRVPDVALRIRRRLRMPFLTVFTYHRIGDARAVGELDPEVVDATVAAFEEQMAWVARTFRVVDTAALVRHLDGAEPLPPNPALVTFDDGYRDTLDVAVPILRHNGLTAVFFVATQVISERRLTWWDRIHLVVGRARVPRLKLQYPEPMELDLAPGERMASTRKLLRIVKDRWNLDIARFIEELTRAAGITWSHDEERALASAAYLDWDGVRALVAAGMDVQSHTRSHRVLQRVPEDELDAELRGSREDLERELGREVRAVAYPTGVAIDNAPAIEAAVRRAGYRVGFSNASGTSWLGRGDGTHLHLRRIAMEDGESLASYKARAALPGWPP